MTTDNAEKFDAWAIVEAMGFKKLAGHVTEQSIAGASLIRVHVPEVVVGDRTYPAYSKLIGAGSIYMITPTDEVTARKAAKVLAQGNDPIPVYIPPEPKQLPTSTTRTDDPDGDGLFDNVVDNHCDICGEFESECTCSEVEEEDPDRPGYYRDGTVIDPVVMEPSV